MDLLIAIGVFAAIVAVWMFISNMVDSASDAVTSAALAPVAKLMDKASLNKVARELAVPHEFRLRAPVEVVRATLENLPGIPDQPPHACFAPFYVVKSEGRIMLGIARDTIPNHYDIEVHYRPEPFGTSGELRFVRWPDDAADDTEAHKDVIETVFGELRHLDPGLQIHRPGAAA